MVVVGGWRSWGNGVPRGRAAGGDASDAESLPGEAADAGVCREPQQRAQPRRDLRVVTAHGQAAEAARDHYRTVRLPIPTAERQGQDLAAQIEVAHPERTDVCCGSGGRHRRGGGPRHLKPLDDGRRQGERRGAIARPEGRRRHELQRPLAVLAVAEQVVPRLAAQLPCPAQAASLVAQTNLLAGGGVLDDPACGFVGEGGDLDAHRVARPGAEWRDRIRLLVGLVVLDRVIEPSGHGTMDVVQFDELRPYAVHRHPPSARHGCLRVDDPEAVAAHDRTQKPLTLSYRAEGTPHVKKLTTKQTPGRGPLAWNSLRPMVPGACGWCGRDCGGGEVDYSGLVLARRRDDQGDAPWLLYPFGDGLGGTPYVVPAADLNVPWANAENPVFVTVCLLSEAHPDGLASPPGALHMTGEAQLALKAKVKWGKGRWTFTHVPLVVERTSPEMIEAGQAQSLLKAAAWVRGERLAESSSLMEAPVAQFEDAWTFLEGRDRQKHDHDAETAIARWGRARCALKGARRSTSAFVNPYAFIPLGLGTSRNPPTHHLGLQSGRRSGRIDVEYTALTPLALSGRGTGSEQDPRRPLFVNSSWFLSGSSIAGPVRALHEALTDSCLRIVDPDYIPVHRDVAQPRSPSTTRIGIIKVIDGKTTIRLAPSIVHGSRRYPAFWVQSERLSERASIKNTNRFHWMDDSRKLEVLGNSRLVLKKKVESDRDGSGDTQSHAKGDSAPEKCTAADCTMDHWATIVATPVAGRGGATRDYWYPFYSLGGLEEAPVDQGVLDQYEEAALASQDVVRIKRGEALKLGVPGYGTRGQVHARPEDGDVMWVTMAGSKVTRITPSVLWRARGERSVKERILGYEACTNPDDLCPSCATFGMVEEREPGSRKGEKASLLAYRGHVRFAHGVISDVDEVATHLVEMGAPKPSAGQFYLVNDGTVAGHTLDEDLRDKRRPLREWGSPADDGERPRQISGRKFWWRSTSVDRHKVPPNGQAHVKMSSYHRLVPVGSTVTFSVWFDNLSAEQIGALLLAVTPDFLHEPDSWSALLKGHEWDPAQMAHLDELSRMTFTTHLGKGKGVGLGAVKSAIKLDPSRSQGFSTWDADRYFKASASDWSDSPGQYVAAFIRSLTSTPSDADTRMRILGILSILAFDWIKSEVIEYPPDDNPGKDFKFDFWKKTTGAASTVDGYLPVLVTLPQADNPDPRIKPPWRQQGQGG